MSHMLTPAKAAEHVGLSVSTLANYAKAGKITRYQLGARKIRYSSEELDGLILPTQLPA